MKMLQAIFSNLALRKIRKEIALAKPPVQQFFALPKVSMFRRQDIWHWLDRFNPRDSSCMRSPLEMFRKILITESHREIEFSITRLNGLSAANDSDYGDMRDFALEGLQHDYDGGRKIRFSTDEDFAFNIGLFEKLIPQPRNIFWNEWNDRYYLCNSGNAHHTAAIYRQCLDQKRDFTFSAKLTTERIDLRVIAQLKPFLVVICEANSALWIYDWSSKYDSNDAWLSREFPFRDHEVFDPSLAMVAMPRNSPLTPFILDWFSRTPGSYYDFSAVLDAYRPAGSCTYQP